MTLKNGTGGQACAACKFQRRRCTPQCLLAPFFPADQPTLFQSVHRLFGVKHVQKLLEHLAPHEKDAAVKSIKYHAAMREKYPVYGCLVEIQHLTYRIRLAEEELLLVLHQLAYYRRRRHHLLQLDDQMPPADDVDDYLSHVQLGMAPPGNGNGISFSKNENAEYYNYNYDKEKNEIDYLLIEQTHVPQEEEHSFFDNIDDAQSYIGQKDVYEYSLESPTKDSKHCSEQMAENELKTAAACFSLTSVN